MVEAHGWLTLRYSDYDSEEEPQRQFVADFKDFVAQRCHWVFSEDYARLINRNGLECFTVDVQHNHKEEPFYILDIFAWVAHHSMGSYGLLHFHDDEDKRHSHEFQTYVVKRGKLLRVVDTLLSPYQEEVERSYDAAEPPQD